MQRGFFGDFGRGPNSTCSEEAYDKVSDGVMIWVPLEVKKGHASFGLYNLVMVPKT